MALQKLVKRTQIADGTIEQENAIINGGMGIWQRGTSFPGSGTQYTADRWRAVCTTPCFDVDRSTDVPLGGGIKYSLQMTGNSPESAGSIRQAIENYEQFVEGSKWILSFWAKSTQETTRYVTYSFADASNDISGLQTPSSETFSITSSWQRFSIPIEPPSRPGGENQFLIAIGTASFGSPVAGTLSNGETMHITGVQLQPGEELRDFQFRNPAQELALCERYYQTSYEEGVAAGTPTQQNLGHPHFYVDSASAAAGILNWKTRMRIAPTVAIYRPSTGALGTVELISEDGFSGSPDQAYIANVEVGESGMSLLNTGGGGEFTGSVGRMVQFHYTADAEL